MEFDEYTYYPQKPVIDDKNSSSIIKTVISLLLFVGLFMLFPISVNFIFLVVLVLFLHEMGHLIAMKSFGYEDVGMLFIPFIGAVVTGRKEEMSQLQRIIIVLAGPLPGIIFGIVLIALVKYGSANPNLLLYGITFVALNVLNLIPLDPLDGGKLFELLFFSYNEKAKIFFTAISAAAMLVLGFIYQSYVVVAMGAFMASRIQSQYKLMRMRNRIAVLDIPLEVSYNNLSDKDYWHIRKEYLSQSNLTGVIEPESKHYDEKEQLLAPAIRNLLRTPVKEDVGLIGKLFVLILWVGAAVGSVWLALSVLNQFKDTIVQ